MNISQQSIPEKILQESILAHVAAAYFAVGKQLERKTQCSATRGFILAALRGGVSLNQNQLAVQLGLDRTVVHRSIKGLVEDGLVSEKKAPTGKAILVKLTPKGEKYRAYLIEQRRTADEKLAHMITPEERSTFLRLLKLVAELEL